MTRGDSAQIRASLATYHFSTPRFLKEWLCYIGSHDYYSDPAPAADLRSNNWVALGPGYSRRIAQMACVHTLEFVSK